MKLNVCRVGLGLSLLLAGCLPGSGHKVLTKENLKPTIEQARGLSFIADVDQRVMSGPDLKARMHQLIDWETVAQEDQLYRMMGFPMDQPLPDLLRSFLGDQVAAFYDFKAHALNLPDDIPIEQQLPLHLHELTHALQDQTFHSGERMHILEESGHSDANLALRSLLEGEAVAVSAFQVFEKTPQKLPALIASAMDASEQEALAKGFPRWLIREVQFPYRYGTAFVAHWYQKDGWETLNRVHTALHIPTAWILHPEETLTDQTLSLPERAAKEGEVLVVKKIMGEFILANWLASHHVDFEPRESAVKGWRADQVSLWQGPDGERLILDVIFSAPDQALAFNRALRHFVLQGRPDARLDLKPDQSWEMKQDPWHWRFFAKEQGWQRFEIMVSKP